MQHDEHRPRHRKGSSLLIKVYVISQVINVARDGEHNSRIVAVRLTSKGAQDIVDSTAGTWVEKHLAVK